ncbi:3,4-dihydroxy-2-butanone-4-phosphate synthase [Neisseriaceae bacterium PsAf]|nr:3,4-dihydroxy-2-butanone-4-phosphate synthase [Neisseriaceae bacterium PsAf]
MANVSTIPEIIEDIKQGKIVILTDDENRENEGDLLMAAEFVTPEAINFMITHARGLVCMPISAEIVNQLQLPLMTDKNEARNRTNFTVSIEAREGITTGISAKDRATTILTAINPEAKPEDIVQPGHIFPLKAEKGGVLVRAGHTEAGVDLAKMAGLREGAVICEVMNADGTMARMPELLEFSEKFDIKVATIADLIAYRNQHEKLIVEKGTREIDTPWGSFELHIYQDTVSDEIHFALVKRDIAPDTEVLVRVHDGINFLDFLSPNPNHSFYLPDVLEKIKNSEAGVAVFLHRGFDSKEILERALMEKDNNKSVGWDTKSYGVGAQILADLGVKKMKIMGTASSFVGLQGFGIEIVSFE